MAMSRANPPVSGVPLRRARSSDHHLHNPSLSDIYIMNTKPTMRVKKPVPPRKKACQICTDSKVRCGLEKPSCLRCLTRGKRCRYPANLSDVAHSAPVVSSGSNTADESYTLEPSQPSFSTTPTTITSPVFSHASTLQTSRHESTQTVDSDLDFNHVDLEPMEDAEKIRDRWLRPFLFTETEQVPKLFNPFTVQFLACVLGSYPNHLLEEKSLPPFIHPLQLSKTIPRTIANCFSLVRMWMNRVPGSEVIVLSTVRQEMARIAQEVGYLPSNDTYLTIVRTRQMTWTCCVPSKYTSST